MKVIAFAQVYNEDKVGNLKPWIKNVNELVDEVVVYDDGSTDSSYETLRSYGVPESNIIRSPVNDFRNEIIHKVQLLELALSKNPDWIVWYDVDTLLDGRMKTQSDLKHFLGNCPPEFGGIAVGHINLWRSPSWHRIDDGYGPDTITPTAFWRNTGNLHFPYGGGLHHPQYPQGMGRVADVWDLKLVHFGFCGHGSMEGPEAIIRKYLTYKANGQVGRALERLIDESGMVLEPVDYAWFPDNARPAVQYPKPEPMTYDHIRFFDTYDDYLRAKQNGDL